MNTTTTETTPAGPIILACIGMPGAGKSEAVLYLEKKGIPFVRFGDITDEGVKELGLPLTPENEREFRENIRKELGMAAYAIKAESKISSLLADHSMIAIDGLYSWEEYILLRKKFPGLLLIHIYAEPKKRYQRLSLRSVRPVPFDKCYERDVSEIEKLNKGGPIAIADFLIQNNSDDLGNLYGQIDSLLNRLSAEEKHD